MASLSGQNPSSTFPSLIKTINNNPVSASLIQLSDGNGVGIPINVSTNNVFINSPLTASTVTATNNGNGTNFRVGDDVWIGDVNIANTMQVRGIQDATKGYVKFGSGSSTPIVGSTAGTSILELTGSLNVSGTIVGSIASASYSVSSSLAQTASYVANAVSSSRAISAANADTASFVVTAQTASYVLNAISSSNSVSSSYSDTSLFAESSLSTLNAVNAVTASYVAQVESASYALTASYALNAIVTASVLNTTITFTKGDNTTFDVTVAQSGSVATASYALFAEQAATASYVATVESASYALTASYALDTPGLSIDNGTTVVSNVKQFSITANVTERAPGAAQIEINRLERAGSSIELDDVAALDLTNYGVIKNTSDSETVTIVGNNLGAANLVWTTPSGAAASNPIASGELLHIVSVNSDGIYFGTNISESLFPNFWYFGLDGTSEFPGLINGTITNALTASYLLGTIESASYALTASYALNGGGTSIDTGSFATTGSNTFFGDQTVSGSLLLTGNISGALALVDSVETFTSQVNFVPDSAGDGSGFSTIELRPDIRATSDQYLIIDPTDPGHIHIRAGGTQDNSSASLIIGGETSNFTIPAGLNSSPYISSNNSVWRFVEDGSIVFPDYTVQLTAFPGTGSFAITGSNTFVGDQSITGIVNVTGSINSTDSINALSLTTGYETKIGPNAGVINQGSSAVAIGVQAGASNQGGYSIAIGTNAGFENQADNSIVLNADGTVLNPPTQGLFINPVRNVFYENVLFYDTTSKEISYSTASTFATTNANTFNGNQSITGSLYISENLVVQGSSSINYISQSTLNIGTNLITVNTQNPSSRFGGLAVIDSGSAPQVSGSLLFDSINDEWVFVHQTHSGSATTSSVMITGPETYNNIGNEASLTTSRLTKAGDGFHLYDSNITDTGILVSVNSNTQITGSLTVSGNIAGTVATASYVENAQTASYILNAVSASRAVTAVNALTASSAVTSLISVNSQNANFAITASFATSSITAQTASYVLNAVSASRAATASIATTATTALSLDVTNIAINQEYGIPFMITASGVEVRSLFGDTAPGLAYNPSTKRTRLTNLVATGSLFGTSSWASNAISASFITTAQTASYVLNAVSASFALTANNFIGSASFATTGSNTFTGNQTIQGLVSASVFSTGDRVRFGSNAGATSQGQNAIAIGSEAGITTQAIRSIAIGPQAGWQNQGSYAIAIGDSAGLLEQGSGTIAIGINAGFSNQGGIAIGQTAGGSDQGTNAVAIGYLAGQTLQGQNSIAIGAYAGSGSSNQADRTIILNASGTGLSGVNNQTDSLYIDPIRINTGSVANALYYNTATKEITYSTNEWISAGTIQSVGWAATTTAPTIGSTSRNDMSYRRLTDKDWEVSMVFDNLSGNLNGSGDYLFTLPNSLTFDTTLPYQQAYTSGVGTDSWSNADFAMPASGLINNGTVGGQVYPVVYNSTMFRILTTTFGTGIRFWSSAFYQLGGIISMTFRFRTP